MAPVDFLGYDYSVAMTTATQGGSTNPVLAAFELFLFGGEPDQIFEFQSTTNLAGGAWATIATLELFDSSGTIYLLRDRDLTNTPPQEFCRTRLVP